MGHPAMHFSMTPTQISPDSPKFPPSSPLTQVAGGGLQLHPLRPRDAVDVARAAAQHPLLLRLQLSARQLGGFGCHLSGGCSRGRLRLAAHPAAWVPKCIYLCEGLAYCKGLAWCKGWSGVQSNAEEVLNIKHGLPVLLGEQVGTGKSLALPGLGWGWVGPTPEAGTPQPGRMWQEGTPAPAVEWF